MKIIRSMISIALLVGVIAAPAMAWIPAASVHPHTGSCHEHTKPQPVSASCCQVGHQNALVQSSAQVQCSSELAPFDAEQVSLVRVELTAVIQSELFASSPPLIPLRI